MGPMEALSKSKVLPLMAAFASTIGAPRLAWDTSVAPAVAWFQFHHHLLTTTLAWFHWSGQVQNQMAIWQIVMHMLSMNA